MEAGITTNPATDTKRNPLERRPSISCGLTVKPPDGFSHSPGNARGFASRLSDYAAGGIASPQG